MYNEERKKAYLKEIGEETRKSRDMTSLFGKIESVERKHDKDLSQMNEDQAKEAIRSVTSSSPTKLEYQKKVLDEYCAWCLKNFDDANESFLNIENDSVVAIAKTVFLGPDDLRLYLEATYAPLDMYSTELVYIGASWLIFMGIHMDDVFDVEADDVDLDNMVVHFEGSDYKIPEQAVEAFVLLKNLKKFNVVRCQRDGFVIIGSHPVYRERGNKLLRGTEGRVGERSKWFRMSFCRNGKRRIGALKYAGDRLLNADSLSAVADCWEIYNSPNESEAMNAIIRRNESRTIKRGGSISTSSVMRTQRKYRLKKRYLFWKEAYEEFARTLPKFESGTSHLDIPENLLVD